MMVRRAVLIIVLAVLFSACGGESDREPDVAAAPPPGDAFAAVEHPDLSGTDPAVRERLATERRRFEELLAADSDPENLALGYGVMGRLYHAHDFLLPAVASYRNAVRLAPRDFQWHYYLGILYQALGRQDDAERKLEAALALEPADAATLRRLGDLARAGERSEKAGGLYRRALDAEPACWAARFGLAEIARDRGDLETAVADYRGVLAGQPDADQVHYPLAQTLLRLGRREEAEPHLRQSAQRAGGGAAAGGLARCPDPLDDDIVLLITGAPIHLTRGRQAAQEGDFELELAEYRKAVELAPELPIALQTLGRALAQRGQAAEAHALYARAAELEPGNVDLRHDLGLLALSLGRAEEAQRHFEAVLELRPDRVDTRLHLGRLLQQQGRIPDAMTLYEHVLEAEPAHPLARFQRATCLVQLGRRAEAAADLADLLDGSPPPGAPNRLQVASALAALGDHDRALVHLQAVLDLDPDAATAARAHATLAALYQARGDGVRAAEHQAAAQALTGSG